MCRLCFVSFILKVFALTAALLGARFRAGSNAGLLGLGALPGLGGGTSINDTGDGGGDESIDLDIPAGCNMGRRRSRAVLYQLSGHYKPEKSVKTKLKLGNVSMWMQHVLLSFYYILTTKMR